MQDWSAALAGVDVVIHLAARVHQMREDRSTAEAAYLRTNFEATRRLAEQAARAGVRRFVFVSSIKVNGEASSGRALTEEDPPAPRDPYGRSKWLAEQALRELAEGSAMEWVVVRPPLVYGVGVKGNFARLLWLVRKGLPVPRTEARRSYVNVWNLADLLLLCCTHPAAANQLFLAEDVTLTTPALVSHLAILMQRPLRLLPMPAWLARALTAFPLTGPVMARLGGALMVSSQKARVRLGWTPRCSLDEALRRTLVAAPRERG